MHAAQTSSGQLYYGKYRAKVLENEDPLLLGRIIANVAAVPGSQLNWALPCVPYAGSGVGFYAIPPVGANVWIEFEGGDPNYPIWSGCFWGPDEVPTPAGPPQPATKVFKTEFITMILNDAPDVGGFTLECKPEAVATPLKMIFNSEGIEINAAPAIIRMVVEEGITIQYPPGTISMTEAVIEVAIPAATMTLTEELIEIEAPDINVTAEAAVEIEAGLDASVTAGGAIEITAGADVAVTAGAAIEITAPADMAITAVGAMELTAVGIAMTGLVEVTGDLLIDGQQPIVI